MTSILKRAGLGLSCIMVAMTVVMAFAETAEARCETRERKCQLGACAEIWWNGGCAGNGNDTSYGNLRFRPANVGGDRECKYQLFHYANGGALGPVTQVPCDNNWIHVPSNVGRVWAQIREIVASHIVDVQLNETLCNVRSCTDGNDCTQDVCRENGDCGHSCKNGQTCFDGPDCNVCDNDGVTGACRCH